MTLDSLTPNPRNPRHITKDAAAALAKSLAHFGDLGGITKNLTTGNLIGGHQRVAAFKAGEATVKPGKRLKEPDATGTVAIGYIEANGTRYSYREVEWDQAKETAAMIAANQHGGHWDDNALASLLRELDTTELLGFTDEELKRLMPPPAQAPAQFPAHDENIPVQHVCPKCSYAWSGKPS